MKKVPRLVLWIFMVGMLAGCFNLDSQGDAIGSESTLPPSPVVSKISSTQPEAKTSTPVPILTKTPTSIQPTASSTSTPTPTLFTPILAVNQKQVVRQVCPALGKYNPEVTDLKGNLVVWASPEEAFLFDLAKGDRKDIPLNGETLLQFSSSNDGSYLTYSESNSNGYKQYIVNGNLDIIWSTQIIGMTNTWSFSSYGTWLHRYIYFDEGGRWLSWSHEEYYNPFSEELVTLYLDLPFLRKGYDIPKWNPKYDPTFTRVLYAKCDPDCVWKSTKVGYEPKWPVVLYDLTEKKEIASFWTSDGWEGEPKWAPSGEYAVLMADVDPERYDAYEIYLINREGEIHQITNFMSVFAGVRFEPLSPINLSPDGKKVAFWIHLGTDPGNDYQFGVLDLDSGEVTIYCFEPEAGGYEWAPDSKNIALEIIKPGTIKEHIIIVLDIEKGTAVKVLDQDGLVGWMAAP